MNVSCMTEALFPVSRKAIRRKEPKAANDFTAKREQSSDKKYSLDDLLNASQSRELFFPAKNPPKEKSKHNPSRPVPRHADELLWSSIGRKMLGDGISRKRPNASENVHGDDCIQSKQKPTKQKVLIMNLLPCFCMR